MKILALDCGKNKSVFIDYQTGNGPREFGKVLTRAAEIHDLLLQRKPDVFVLEAGADAGWIYDKRKKIAIVAVARRLLVRLWAMLRDGTTWKEPMLRAEVTHG